ncbi:MAG: alpha-amylase family glycosyl hydrolase [Arcanobacterium sp.]|nr:alpha-amylase family glycosyl hydrolase [Arcanobacterium sp.]
MDTLYPRPEWLKQAIFYEIYPQSFQDSNGDGIGDIQGIISRLDYIRSLGATAIWLNPCFDSPFKDAGYDVRDYTQVAPRYGSNADLIQLFEAAHARDMHVILDLVPGHTSEEHEWFLKGSQRKAADRGEFSDRHIWTDSWMAGGAGYPFIGGETERNATYILNFFKCQPALNYGWAHPQYSWQSPVLGDAARATATAMADVMRYWLSRGADGFRVDMADSLVKSDDKGKPETIRTWRYIFDQVRPEFPQAAFVSEWGVPEFSMKAGFDMDFYLDWRWNEQANGYAMLLRDTSTPMERDGDASYFNADSGTRIAPFLKEYVPQLRAAQAAGGSFSLITCNHDTVRLAPRLTDREIMLAYATLLTMPGIPFIYYGDEIAMRYQDLPTKEGGYTRTGSRTPMQWDASANMGFSTATAESLYLPVDPEVSAPQVAAQIGDPHSLWQLIHNVLELRRLEPALQADAGFDPHVIGDEKRSFAFWRYRDEHSVLVAVNPGRDPETIDTAGRTSLVFGVGNPVLSEKMLVLPGQSFAVVR